MLIICLLSLIISHMGLISVQSKEQIEETIHQLMDQNDFFQAKAVLVQEISQNLFLSERFDYESYQNMKNQIFERLTREYESVPFIFYQLFEKINWKDLQKELTAYQEKIQTQMEAFFISMSTQKSFYQLPLLEEDKENIRIIIETMAEKTLVELAFKQRHLEKKGDQVNYIHPLRFIGYIFSDEKLKKCMYQIKASRFKWKEFIKGFSRRMDEEYDIDNLIHFIPEFVEQVHPRHPERMEDFIRKKSWEELVADLLN